MAGAKQSVLVVDDDPVAVQVLEQQIRNHYPVVTALGGQAGLETLQRDGPFTVLVSDLRMPDLSGPALLAEARRLAPDTVRILLTAHADVEAAVWAVNEGGVFRFLFKPCPPQALLVALRDAMQQHELMVAERELLEQTLRGSVAALLETLSLANPLAFARAVRIRDAVGEMLDALDIGRPWLIDIAAMLSQMGAVTLPPTVVEKLHEGRPLRADEEAMARRLPELAERLLEPIPRLDPVREIVRWQRRRFDGREREPGPGGERIPLGARILHIVLDYDPLHARGWEANEIAAELRRHKGRYDPELLDVFLRRLVEREADAQAQGARKLALDELVPGMVLVSDVRASDGVLLVASGHKVTLGLLERLRNFAAKVGISEPIEVVDSV